MIRLNRDHAIAAGLFLLAVVTRLPLRTQMLWTWDSANFALATQHFDVTLHQPHPPGYIYFVGLARLFDLAVGDVNLAFIIENILFTGLAVIAMYYLGKALYDRRTGVIAALLLTFSVTFWTYGIVALTYPALCFFTVVIALLAYRTIFQQSRHLLWLSLAYAAVGGFRPDLLLFLAPLYLAALYRRRLPQIAGSLLIVLAGFALWFIPTVWLSGGLQAYVDVFTAYTSVDVVQRYSVLDGGLAALWVNVRDTASYIFYATYAIAGLLLVGMLLTISRPRTWFTRQSLFLAGWVAPMLLFYLFIHMGDTGYAFTLLPALCLLAARAALLPLLQRTRLSYAIVALVIVANVAIFFVHDRPLTWPGVSRQDQTTAAKIAYIRANVPQEATLLVSYELYKHLRFYLPQYDALWLDPFGKGIGQMPLQPGTTAIVLVDHSLRGLNPGVEEVRLATGSLYVLPVKPGQGLVYSATALYLQ